MREKIMTAEDFIQLLEPINFRVWSKSSSPTVGRRNVYQLVGGWSASAGKELRRLFKLINADPMIVSNNNDNRFKQEYCKDRIMAALELIRQTETAECERLTRNFPLFLVAWGINRQIAEEA